MNQEIKARWVAALRSGDYVQGTGMLRSSIDTYCCLGVLCDLAWREDVVTRDESEGVTSYEDGIYESDGYLPRAVIAWAGLVLNDPVLTGPHDGTLSASASAWNDELHATFSQIADMIEVSL